MANRLKFLYCDITELWGRMRKARAGKGKAGTSEVGDGKVKPFINPKT
jgi:hypothetical protein